MNNDNSGGVEKNFKKPLAKAFSIIGTVLAVLIAVMTAVIVINMIYCRANNKPVTFFGTSFAIVQTESMEPYIKVGDLIVIHTCQYDEVEVGDNIVFIAGDGFGRLKGQSVVHEAVEITPDGIVTKGKNEKANPVPDVDKVTENNLIGICVSNSAGWGKAISFLSKFGILIVVAILGIPFIVGQIIKIYKIAKQRKEEENRLKIDMIGEPFVLSDENKVQNESVSSEEINVDDKSNVNNDNIYE